MERSFAAESKTKVLKEQEAPAQHQTPVGAHLPHLAHFHGSIAEKTLNWRLAASRAVKVKVAIRAKKRAADKEKSVDMPVRCPPQNKQFLLFNQSFDLCCGLIRCMSGLVAPCAAALSSVAVFVWWHGWVPVPETGFIVQGCTRQAHRGGGQAACCGPSIRALGWPSRSGPAAKVASLGWLGRMNRAAWRR